MTKTAGFKLEERLDRWRARRKTTCYRWIGRQKNEDCSMEWGRPRKELNCNLQSKEGRKGEGKVLRVGRVGFMADWQSVGRVRRSRSSGKTIFDLETFWGREEGERNGRRSRAGFLVLSESTLRRLLLLLLSNALASGQYNCRVELI